MIKLIIVDDHEVVRLGLRSLFEQYPGFKVVGEAGSAEEAVKRVAEFLPDVVIMDVRMPKGSGIEACREITGRFPRTKVLMLTSYGDEETIFASIMAGAKGYVLKEVGNEELIRAIEVVSRGDSLLDPVITQKVLSYIRNETFHPEDELDILTTQEKKVLSFVAKGKTNREIAEEVFLSEKTVRNYVSSILNKLNLNNRAEAAVFATQRKISSP